MDPSLIRVDSGNRNFEARVHPLTRANYLASPPLVVAYALAGTMKIDFETEPIGVGKAGPVYLRDIWPSRSEIEEFVSKYVQPTMFAEAYGAVKVCRGPLSLYRCVCVTDYADYFFELSAWYRAVEQYGSTAIRSVVVASIYAEECRLLMLSPRAGLYEWDSASTYIHDPPFFKNFVRRYSSRYRLLS